VQSPPLCRACGVLLRYIDHSSQQLHDWCRHLTPGTGFRPTHFPDKHTDQTADT
jgi:hypothetical protein